VLTISSWVPLTGPRRFRALLVHAFAGAAFAFTHVALWQIFAALLRTLIFGDAVPQSFRNPRGPMRLHVEWEMTMYWALVGLAHAMMFRAEARERTLRTAQLEAQLAQAQLQALQRQLQPHFLFNTLQTISALVHRDVNEADRMIERLGDLLRMTLRAGDLTEVPLSVELEHVRHYAAIEEANMGARLKIDIDAAPDVLSTPVPSLLLQPLVENAVRHGVAPRANGGRVAIKAWGENETLYLRVEDNGVGLRGQSRTGIGLQNTRQRLEQAYGGRQHFSIESGADGGVVASIRLPRRSDVPAAQTAR
jgi:LytS/YehU family sensor histidine kinase